MQLSLLDIDDDFGFVLSKHDLGISSGSSYSEARNSKDFFSKANDMVLEEMIEDALDAKLEEEDIKRSSLSKRSYNKLRKAIEDDHDEELARLHQLNNISYILSVTGFSQVYKASSLRSNPVYSKNELETSRFLAKQVLSGRRITSRRLGIDFDSVKYLLSYMLLRDDLSRDKLLFKGHDVSRLNLPETDEKTKSFFKNYTCKELVDPKVPFKSPDEIYQILKEKKITNKKHILKKGHFPNIKILQTAKGLALINENSLPKDYTPNADIRKARNFLPLAMDLLPLNGHRKNGHVTSYYQPISSLGTFLSKCSYAKNGCPPSYLNHIKNRHGLDPLPLIEKIVPIENGSFPLHANGRIFDNGSLARLYAHCKFGFTYSYKDKLYLSMTSFKDREDYFKELFGFFGIPINGGFKINGRKSRNPEKPNYTMRIPEWHKRLFQNIDARVLEQDFRDTRFAEEVISEFRRFYPLHGIYHKNIERNSETLARLNSLTKQKIYTKRPGP